MWIKNIGFSRGYSGADHLLDDMAIKDLIGENVRTVRDVKRMVEKTNREYPQDRRCATPPVWVQLNTGIEIIV